MPFFSNANTNDTLPVKHEVIAVAESVTAEGKELSEKDKESEERKEFIQHHLLDSHDFHLFSYEDDAKVEHHIGFPLPVILWDGGLHIFSSSAFHHGEKAAESNGSFYRLHHEKIYKVNSADEELTLNEEHHPTNAKPIDLSLPKMFL